MRRARLVCAALVSSAALASGADDAGTALVVATKDGMKLAASRWDSAERDAAGVVLLHMEKSDRSAWAALVPHLRTRGLAVLAVDLRGCGGSVKQTTGGNLAQRMERRDPKLFASLEEDAVAAARSLVKDGKCGAKRIVLVGAGVGGAAAFDAARRFPDEIAAVAWMTPATDVPGIDVLEVAKTWPADKPLLLLAQAADKAGAEAVHAALPKSSLLVYDDAPPAAAKGDGDAWARGTKMLGRLPLVEQTLASFAAARTGSKRDDVVLDGVIDEEGAEGGAWTRAANVSRNLSMKGWAYRVGRRVEFGGVVKTKAKAVQVGMATHFKAGTAPYVAVMTDGEDIGMPEIAAIDLEKSVFAWVEPIDSGKSMSGRSTADRVRPVVRAVRTADGFTFEGEWITDYGDGPKGPVDPQSARIALTPYDAAPPRPESVGHGGVKIEIDWLPEAVEATPR